MGKQLDYMSTCRACDWPELVAHMPANAWINTFQSWLTYNYTSISMSLKNTYKAPTVAHAFCRYTGHTLAKFCVTFATGVVTGLTAATVVAILEFVFARKRQAVQWMIYAVHKHGLLAGFGLHLLITTSLLMAGALLVSAQAQPLCRCQPGDGPKLACTSLLLAPAC